MRREGLKREFFFLSSFPNKMSQKKLVVKSSKSLSDSSTPKVTDVTTSTTPLKSGPIVVKTKPLTLKQKIVGYLQGQSVKFDKKKSIKDLYTEYSPKFPEFFESLNITFQEVDPVADAAAASDPVTADPKPIEGFDEEFDTYCSEQHSEVGDESLRDLIIELHNKLDVLTVIVGRNSIIGKTVRIETI